MTDDIVVTGMKFALVGLIVWIAVQHIQDSFETSKWLRSLGPDLLKLKELHQEDEMEPDLDDDDDYHSLASAYSYGGPALPGLRQYSRSATNYNVPTQWTQIGFLKTTDITDDTIYPLYERKLSPHLDMFQYGMSMIDRRGSVVYPLDSSSFLENGDVVGPLNGIESKGTLTVSRFKNFSWGFA